MSGPAAHPARLSRLSAALSVLVALLTLVGTGVSWWQARQSDELLRQEILLRTEQRGSQLAEAMGGQVETLLSAIDIGLQDLRRGWLGDAQAFAPVARAVLASLPEGAVTHITVAGADGQTVFNSLPAGESVFVGDRDHFKVHLDGADRLHVGKPVFSRLSRRWVIIVNRPLLRGGRFAGTLNMSVSAAYISERLATLALSERDVVTLMHADGSYLARSRDYERVMGQSLPAERAFLADPGVLRGVFRGASQSDGIARLYAWQRLRPQGIVTAVGLAESDALAPVVAGIARQRPVVHALIVIAACFGAGVSLLLWRASRHHLALERLNEELEQRVEHRTAELRAAKEEAERANRAKSEFLSAMSHELRTPLNAVLGFGQLLQLDMRPGRQADQVREIVRAGQHLLELINEVLDLARVESGRLAVSLEPVALRPVLQTSLRLVHPQAEAAGLSLPEADTAGDMYVQADRTRLKQLLLNLLSNAVKYNRPGGSIGIGCERLVTDAGPMVRITVSDTGRGLDPTQCARLFTAFERLGADRQPIEGTGIGLALSKRLVELMGGSIGVHSTPGVGSRFWVELPQAEGREAATEELRVRAPA